MKILIVTEYFPESLICATKGGVEARSMYISQELSKNHDVTVLCSYQNGQKREDLIGKVKVIRVGFNHPYTSGGSIFTRIQYALAAYFKGKKLKHADVVEGYNFISYLPAYFIGKKMHAKKIATYHEVWIGEWVKNKGIVTGAFGSAWERIVLNLKWDKIISVSEFTAKKIEKYQDKNKIKVIPNGVEFEKYRAIKVKKEIAPTITCIARLIPSKRVDDLIRAIAIIKKSIPNIQCRLIGRGPELDYLKKLSKDLNVEENVKFLGFIEEKNNVIAELKKSHVFVLPSIVEGFGMVVVEAMVCRVPYVATDIPPIREASGNSLGGFLFEPKNHQDLAKKIEKLLKDKKLYSTKIKEMEKYVEKYDWEKIVSDVKKVYL